MILNFKKILLYFIILNIPFLFNLNPIPQRDALNLITGIKKSKFGNNWQNVLDYLNNAQTNIAAAQQLPALRNQVQQAQDQVQAANDLRQQQAQQAQAQLQQEQNDAERLQVLLNTANQRATGAEAERDELAQRPAPEDLEALRNELAQRPTADELQQLRNKLEAENARLLEAQTKAQADLEEAARKAEEDARNVQAERDAARLATELLEKQDVEIKKLIKELDEAKREERKQRKKRNEIRAEFEGKQARFDDIELSSIDLQLNLKVLESQNLELKTEQNRLREKFEKEILEEITERDKSREQLRTAQANLEEANKRAQDAQAERDKRPTTEDLQRLQRELAQLRERQIDPEELAQLRANLAAAQAEEDISGLNKQLEDMTAQNTKLKNRIDLTTKNLAEIRVELITSNNKNEKLSEELNQKINKLKETQSNIAQTNRDLMGQNRELIEQDRGLTEQNTDLEKNIQALQEEVNEEQEKVKRLENELAIRKQQQIPEETILALKILQERNSILEELNSQSNKIEETFKNLVAKLKEDNQRLQEQLTNAQNQSKEAEENLEELK